MMCRWDAGNDEKAGRRAPFRCIEAPATRVFGAWKRVANMGSALTR